MEDARFLDEKDGTEVCMDCGLVLQDYLPCNRSNGLSENMENSDSEQEIENLGKKILPFGARISKNDQRVYLLDWAENGHLPRAIVDQTWAGTKEMLRGFDPESIHRRDKISFNFEEFSAVALSQALFKQENPRALSVIARITGVPEKKLSRISKLFPMPFNQSQFRPSNWMAGLLPSLPITYREGVHIGKIADSLSSDFAYNPLSLLVVCIYAYLNYRKTNSIMCSKTELSKLTGVSSGTITKGYRRAIEENPRFNVTMLHFTPVSVIDVK